MQVPDTHFARTGDLRIAHQTWGDGPPLMIIADLISNVEIIWEHEFYRRTLERLGRSMTCACFDKRGIGMSDRFEQAPTIEQRNEDILAVMDALEWDSAHVVGQSEGAAMAMVFAVEHPGRIDTLTLMNTFLPPRYIPRIFDFLEDDDPPLLGREEIYEHFMEVMETWGEDATFLVDWACPSKLGNEAFERWVSRLCRMAASPKDFKRQLDSIFDLDAGDAPERITAPTLVMHAKGDKELHVSMGRVLGDVIPGAEYYEIEGADHFSWVMENWREATDRIVAHATGKPSPPSADRRFATVLFTDIVDSTRRSSAMGDQSWREVLDAHDRTTRALVDEHRGRVVKSTGDGLLVIFDTPSEAVDCAAKICRELRDIGIEIRAGLHAGEVELHDDGDISGLAVNLAARVEQQAADGEVWASSTVRDLLLGGSAEFVEQGEFELKGIDGAWRLFGVSR